LVCICGIGRKVNNPPIVPFAGMPRSGYVPFGVWFVA